MVFRIEEKLAGNQTLLKFEYIRIFICQRFLDLLAGDRFRKTEDIRRCAVILFKFSACRRFLDVNCQ
jgi:hypothetical protein